jgi:hypothetical protein
MGVTPPYQRCKPMRDRGIFFLRFGLHGRKSGVYFCPLHCPSCSTTLWCSETCFRSSVGEVPARHTRHCPATSRDVLRAGRTGTPGLRVCSMWLRRGSLTVRGAKTQTSGEYAGCHPHRPRVRCGGFTCPFPVWGKGFFVLIPSPCVSVWLVKTRIMPPLEIPSRGQE